jgi:hypothetical protein
MAAAGQQGRPHGMLSVVGLSDEDIAAVCEEARSAAGGAGTVCQLANMLFPQVGKALSRGSATCCLLAHSLTPAALACALAGACKRLLRACTAARRAA